VTGWVGNTVRYGIIDIDKFQLGSRGKVNTERSVLHDPIFVNQAGDDSTLPRETATLGTLFG
jgi:hypothetical protein